MRRSLWRGAIRAQPPRALSPCTGLPPSSSPTEHHPPRSPVTLPWLQLPCPGPAGRRARSLDGAVGAVSELVPGISCVRGHDPLRAGSPAACERPRSTSMLKKAVVLVRMGASRPTATGRRPSHLNTRQDITCSLPKHNSTWHSGIMHRSTAVQHQQSRLVRHNRLKSRRLASGTSRPSMHT